MRQYGRTALMVAAIYGHTDIVRLLLEHGADVNLADKVSAAWQACSCVDLRAGDGCKG